MGRAAPPCRPEVAARIVWLLEVDTSIGRPEEPEPESQGPPRMTPEEWTRRALEAVALRAEGLSGPHIGERLGVSSTWVYRVLHLAGIPASGRSPSE